MRKIFVILFILLFAMPSYSDVIFQWDENTEPDLAGYRLYYGSTSEQIDTLVADNISGGAVILPDLPEGYYAITAYDTEALESELSNAVLLAGYYYNSIRYEYNSSGMIIYMGQHTAHDASEGDMNWVISKYYYSGSMVVQIRIRTTSWTNRAVGW